MDEYAMRCRGVWRRALVICAGILGVTVAFAPSLAAAPSSSSRPTINPGQYAELAKGVALIKTYTCQNRLIGSGTGFLVGRQVLMTARHVTKDACRLKATIGSRTYTLARPLYWHSAPGNEATIDLATAKLDRPVIGGHVFRFAVSTPRGGTTIAMVGHPLGNPLSLAQGRLLATKTQGGVAYLTVYLASAAGSSGSPLLDPRGNVVGILQRGFVRDDFGVVSGVNLARTWGREQAVRDLCRAYPNGGVPRCENSGLDQAAPPASNDETVIVVDYSLGATADGPNQYRFVSSAGAVVVARYRFSEQTTRPHSAVTTLTDHAGATSTPCTGKIVVGWDSLTCKIQLGDFPAAGTWVVRTHIDGKLVSALSFLIEARPAAIPGSYKGATNEGNYVFFDVVGATLVNFRVNDLPQTCSGPYRIYGQANFTGITSQIASDGSFTIQQQYGGTLTWDSGGTTPDFNRVVIKGYVRDAAASGTVTITTEFSRDGQPVTCSSGLLTWSATRLP